MYLKIHKGQGAAWIILILAIVALIALWISKNSPASLPATTSTSTSSAVPTDQTITTPTPTKSLLEIDNALKELNSNAANIDKGINDTQLDITQ